MSCEDTGDPGSNFATNRGTPGAITDERKNKAPPPEASEGAGPCRHLAVIFQISRTVKRYMSVVLSQSPVCGTLL